MSNNTSNQNQNIYKTYSELFGSLQKSGKFQLVNNYIMARAGVPNFVTFASPSFGDKELQVKVAAMIGLALESGDWSAFDSEATVAKGQAVDAPVAQPAEPEEPQATEEEEEVVPNVDRNKPVHSTQEPLEDSEPEESIEEGEDSEEEEEEEEEPEPTNIVRMPQPTTMPDPNMDDPIGVLARAVARRMETDHLLSAGVRQAMQNGGLPVDRIQKIVRDELAKELKPAVKYVVRRALNAALDSLEE